MTITRWNILTKLQSDYSRSQYTEKYIQDRVAAELKKLEAETIQRFKDTTNNSLLKDGDKDSKPELSVPKANARITKLNSVLEENIKLAKVSVNDDVKIARDSVLKCLKENEGKSLNCWDEVKEFKKQVSNL